MEDPRFGLPTGTLRISEEFARQRVRAIKIFSTFFGIVAALFTLFAAGEIYDFLTTGASTRSSAITMTVLALACWGLVALLLIGGLSARNAGMRSEIRLYQNGFVLIQGVRFGGEKKDTCLWDEIDTIVEKGLKGQFFGYAVTKTDGSTIFLAANFENLTEKLSPQFERLAANSA